MFKSTLKLLKLNFDGSNFMSFTLPVGPLKYRIYECPGLWCSDKDLDLITQDLLKVAKKCQGDKEVPIYGVLEGRREDMSHRLITIAYDRKTNEPVGFSAQIFLDLYDEGFHERILHLGLIYVDKSAQGKNISYLLSVFPNLLILVKNGFRDVWISNVSQVPAVVGLVAKNYFNVFPNIDGTKQSFRHQKLADLIIDNHNEAFGVGDDAFWDRDRQIIENAYTGGSDNLKKSFEDSPKHRNEQFNALCKKELNYERGDDFLQLGVLSPSAILTLFKIKMGQGNVILLAVSLIVVAALSVFVPILRWLIKPVNKKSNIEDEQIFI